MFDLLSFAQLNIFLSQHTNIVNMNYSVRIRHF